MATVSDILAKKGSSVFSIPLDASAFSAAVLMNDCKVGSLVVTDNERIEGIVTERDILRRIVAARREPMLTPVNEIMTREVVCCRPETSIEEARGVLMTRRIRHLPVIDEENDLRGLISIGDLNAYQATTQEITIHYLNEYLYGQG